MSELAIIIELLMFLWPFVAIPAALMLFVRPGARLAFFLLGLTSMFAIEYIVELAAPIARGWPIRSLAFAFRSPPCLQRHWFDCFECFGASGMDAQQAESQGRIWRE